MPATRLLRWLTLIALLLAPLAMIGAGPAAAHARAPEVGHCDDMGSPAEAPPAAPADCMIACAGLPAQSGGLAGSTPIEPLPEPLPASLHPRGLQPEAATPPPRIS